MRTHCSQQKWAGVRCGRPDTRSQDLECCPDAAVRHFATDTAGQRVITGGVSAPLPARAVNHPRRPPPAAGLLSALTGSASPEICRRMQAAAVERLPGAGVCS